MKPKKKEGQNVEASALFYKGEPNIHRRKYGDNVWSRVCRKGHPEIASPVATSCIQPPTPDFIVDTGKCLLKVA